MTRSRRLDILRAVSVLLVLGRHMPAAVAQLHPVLTIWQRGGWIGVDLFFVLSGFLVSGLLFTEHRRTGQIRPGRFLLRRGLKIYPAFWVLIAATVAVQHGMIPTPALVCELAFIQNYGPSIWNHTWSLAVEEHFYLALVAYFVWLSRRYPRAAFRRLPYAFAVIAIVELNLRLWTAYTVRNYTFQHLQFPTHLRLDALCCGVVLSYLYHYHHEPLTAWAKRWRGRLIVGAAILLAPPFLASIETSRALGSIGLTGIYLGAACLLVASLTAAEPTHWVLRAAAYIGSRSYSIYLWHMAVITWVLPHLTTVNLPALLGVYLLLSVALGVAMAAIVEYPILRVRDRYWPARPIHAPALAMAGVQ